MQKKYLRDRLSEQPTPFEQVALVQLAEEAAELVQACSKALRWGLDSEHPDFPERGANADMIAREKSDVDEAYRRYLTGGRKTGAAATPTETPDK